MISAHVRGGMLPRGFAPNARLVLSAVFALGMCLFSRSEGYSSYPIRRDLHQLIDEANLIVRGAVVATSPFWLENDRGKNIWTHVSIAISECVKGQFRDSVLDFDAIGGTMEDGQGLTVGDEPIFTGTEGKEFILFLKASPRGWEPIWDGVISVREGVAYSAMAHLRADQFTEYLRLIQDGQNITIDSFIKALPPAPPPPHNLGGGTAPAQEIRHLSKPGAATRQPQYDTVNVNESDTLAHPDSAAHSHKPKVDGWP